MARGSVLCRTSLGWGHLGRRQTARPYKYGRSVQSFINPNEVSALVQIYNKNNVLIDTIRGDVQIPIIEKIEFTIDQKGPRDAKLVLNKLPSIPIQPLSIFKFFFFGSREAAYTGYLKAPERAATRKKSYEFQLHGLALRLDDLTLEGADIPTGVPRLQGAEPGTFAAGLKVTRVVRWIIDAIVVPNVGIGLREGEINTTSSNDRPLTTDFNPGKDSISKIFDALATLNNYVWGVNENGIFFFKPRQETPIRAFIEGYGSQEFTSKENTDAIFNQWTITRKRQADPNSSNGSWSIVRIDKDVTSIAKYGKKEKRYQVPGFLGNDECEAIGTNLLANNKDPKTYFKIKNYVVRNRGDILASGQYRVITGLQEQVESIQECENEDDFTLADPLNHNATYSLNDTILVSGNSSLNIDTTGTFVLQCGLRDSDGPLPAYDRPIIELIFRYRFTVVSREIAIDFFDGDNSVHTESLIADTANVFIERRFTFPVEGRPDRITRFELRRETDGERFEFYLDSVDVLSEYQNNQVVELNRARYSLSSRNYRANLEFGPEIPRLENYMANLFNIAEQADLSGEG